MSNEIHGELKREFQLERMILFSDAVFAIAITLLVIEMKIPEIPEELISEHTLAQSLGHLIPKLIGFFISFMLIGLYWTVHHRLFGYVTNYDQRLLWINLFFLMAVALMPFSTAFYSEYVFRLLKSPVIIYVINICFLGIMNFVLWKHVSSPKRKLTEGLSQPVARYYALRAIAVPIIFFVMGVAYLFVPRLAILIPMLTPLVMKMVFKPMRKKLILTKELAA